MTNTQKAITYSRTGSSDVLTPVDRAAPEPGTGEVVVRIAVSGVNPTDWKARAGSGSSEELPAPQVPNQDGAGMVAAIGADVETLAVGDRVWVWDAAYQRTDGTAQELCLVPAAQAVPLPDGVSFDVGASLGIPALTAHSALTASDSVPARLSPGSLAGRPLLVSGGAGAVGHAAIQLAVWAGATVITTISSDEKAALARAAGAHHVIDYTTEDVVARVHEIAPDGVDIVVEVNPNANAAIDAQVVAAHGSVVSYASDPDAPTVEIPVRDSMSKNVRWQFLLTYSVTDEQKADAVAAVSAAVADGALEVGEANGLPLTRFPFVDIAAAHDAVEDGAVGKVLIDVADL